MPYNYFNLLGGNGSYALFGVVTLVAALFYFGEIKYV